MQSHVKYVTEWIGDSEADSATGSWRKVLPGDLLTFYPSPNSYRIIQIEKETEGALIRLGRIKINNSDWKLLRKDATWKA